MTSVQNPFPDYIGRQQQHNDCLVEYPLRAMTALLDLPGCHWHSGDEIPPLWHWLYFLEPAAQSRLATDGHPRRGDFLPPIELPRRMWAGSRLRWHAPLRLGQSVTRQSRIDDITCKQGRSGDLAFVSIAHRYLDQQQLLLEEQQTLVFRQASPQQAPTPQASPALQSGDLHQPLCADATLLFRYSALTFNAHRIHYDRDYARQQEHYPDLVVHGPLLATALAQLLTSAGEQLQQFDYRALAPTFAGEQLNLVARPTGSGQWQLWVANDRQELCLQATAETRTRHP